MTNEEKKAFNAFVEQCQLGEIVPLAYAAQRAAQPPAQHEPVDLHLRTHVTGIPEEGGFGFIFDLTAEGRRPATGEGMPLPAPFVTIRYTIAAKYRYAGPAVDESVKHLFAERTSILHVWPYFRFFVQEATSRFAMPNIILPVLRSTGIKLQPAPVAPAATTPSSDA